MSKLIKKIYDCATGQTIEREFTDEEFAQYKLDAANYEKSKAEAEAKAIARAELLDRIGLTADELKTILG